MKKSNGRRTRQMAKQLKKRRTKLRAEQLESRLMLAADFDYSAQREFMDSDEYESHTNMVDSGDVNNDSKFNVLDGHLLIEKARTLMKMTGAPSYRFGETDLTDAVGEGDANANSFFVDSNGEKIFADTNGDNKFNLQDVFGTVRALMSEGEAAPVLAWSFLLYESANPAFTPPVGNPPDATRGTPNENKVEIQQFTSGVAANVTTAVHDLRAVGTKGVGAAYFDVAFEQGFDLSVAARAGAHGSGALVFNAVNSSTDLQSGVVFPNFGNPLGLQDAGTSDFEDLFTLNGESWEMFDISLIINGARLAGQDDLAGVVQGQSVNIAVLDNDLVDNMFQVQGNEATSSADLISVFQSPADNAPANMTDFGSREFEVRGPSGEELVKGIQNITQGTKGNASINNNGTPGDPTDDFIVYAANATATGTDTISYELTDGINAQTIDVTIEIGEVNDPPVLTVNSPVATNENTAVPLTVSVTDPDAGADPLSFTLMATSGNLTIANTTNLSNVVGNGTTSVSFDASQANANSAFGGLSYDPIGEFSGSDTVDVTADDNGSNGVGGPQSDAESITVNVAAVNDPPVNTVPGPQSVFNTDTLNITGLSVADIDAGAGNLMVDFGVSNGTLTLTNTTNLTVNSNGAANVSFEGTLTDLNNALGSGLVYDPTDTFIGADTLSMTTDDLGNTPLPAQTDTDTVTIDVTPPIVPFAADDILVVEEDSTAGAANQVNAFSNDLNGAIVIGGADLVVDSFTQGLTGGGSVAHIGNGVFEYIPVADFFGTDTFEYTISDSVNLPNDGPNTGTVNVTINPVNDDPTITAPGTATTDEDTIYDFTNGSTISIADIDAGSGDLTVILTTGSNGEVVVNPGAATASANRGSSITLTGTVAELNGALGSLQYDPDLNYNGPDTLSISVDDNFNTGPITGTDSETVDITINPINDAPEFTIPPQDAFVTKNFDFVFENGFTVTLDDVDALPADVLTTTISISTNAAGPIGSIALGDAGVVNVTNQTPTSITFEGTLANSNTAIDGLTYSPGVEFVGIVDVDFMSNDGGANGASGPKIGTATKEVEVLDFIPSDLSGFLFIDGNKDGMKQGVELGVTNLIVRLTGTDVTNTPVNLSTTTNDDGFYEFTNLAPPLQSTAGYTISYDHSQASLFKDWTDYIGTQGGTASSNSLLIPSDTFLVNGQPLGGVSGTGNNFTFLGPDAQYINPFRWFLASSFENGTAPNRLLLSVDANGNAMNWISFNGWNGYTDFDVLNVNANHTQATLEAVNGSTMQGTLNFPIIQCLGDDGNGNTMYWIEGSANDLLSQAAPQAEGEGEADSLPEDARMEEAMEIEMLAAAMEREASQDFEQAVDEVFAGDDIA